MLFGKKPPTLPSTNAPAQPPAPSAIATTVSAEARIAVSPNGTKPWTLAAANTTSIDRRHPLPTRAAITFAEPDAIKHAGCEPFVAQGKLSAALSAWRSR
jgi:hypothetical protein